MATSDDVVDVSRGGIEFRIDLYVGTSPVVPRCRVLEASMTKLTSPEGTGRGGANVTSRSGTASGGNDGRE